MLELKDPKIVNYRVMNEKGLYVGTARDVLTKGVGGWRGDVNGSVIGVPN